MAGSIGSGLYAGNKNKKTADKFIVERQNIEKAIQKFNSMNADINALTEVTKKQIVGVNDAVNSVKGSDYSKFSDDEKLQLGMLINSTLSLAQLINKELTIDE